MYTFRLILELDPYRQYVANIFLKTIIFLKLARVGNITVKDAHTLK
jgi:hypothetical protein